MGFSIAQFDELFCPVAICDFCGERIVNDADGLVLYDHTKVPVAVHVVHRGRCDEMFCAKVPNGRALWNTGLSDYIRDLVLNLKKKSPVTRLED